MWTAVIDGVYIAFVVKQCDWAAGRHRDRPPSLTETVDIGHLRPILRRVI